MSSARDRIAKFCVVYEKMHPRQPLEDSICGLQTGDVNEAELTLSDLKALLAEGTALADPIPTPTLAEGDQVEVVDGSVLTRGKVGTVTPDPDLPRGAKVMVQFRDGWYGCYLPTQLRKVN